MQIFDENPKRICCCNEAIKKGIYAQSLHNDTFSIYGNLMQGKSILLNYSGKLVEKISNSSDTAPNIYMYYCFDNDWENKRIINMSVCKKQTSLSYCSIIELPECSSINIAFTNQNDEWDTDTKGTYYVKIYPDVEKAIIKRYGLDSTPPTLVPDNLPSSHNSLIKVVKEKLISVFSFFKLKRC